MQPAIAERRTGLIELCQRFRVRRLDLFGSAASGAFDPARSGLDFLVEFEPHSPLRALDAFFGFKDGLEALFGRPVDLVMTGAVTNPYLQAGIDASRETLYAA